MNVDHINRHEILDNNNRMVIYCNEKTKNRYLNCFKKNQIFIRYQAKIANKRRELKGEGMKVSGMYIKLTEPIVRRVIHTEHHYIHISIKVQKVDSNFPFEFYLNKPEITQMCNWYTSGRGRPGGVIFNGSVGNISKDNVKQDIIDNYLKNYNYRINERNII